MESFSQHDPDEENVDIDSQEVTSDIFDDLEMNDVNINFLSYQRPEDSIQISQSTCLALTVMAALALILSIFAVSGLKFSLDNDIIHTFVGPDFQIGHRVTTISTKSNADFDVYIQHATQSVSLSQYLHHVDVDNLDPEAFASMETMRTAVDVARMLQTTIDLTPQQSMRVYQHTARPSWAENPSGPRPSASESHPRPSASEKDIWTHHGRERQPFPATTYHHHRHTPLSLATGRTLVSQLFDLYQSVMWHRYGIDVDGDIDDKNVDDNGNGGIDIHMTASRHETRSNPNPLRDRVGPSMRATDSNVQTQQHNQQHDRFMAFLARKRRQRGDETGVIEGTASTPTQMACMNANDGKNDNKSTHSPPYAPISTTKFRQFLSRIDSIPDNKVSPPHRKPHQKPHRNNSSESASVQPIAHQATHRSHPHGHLHPHSHHHHAVQTNTSRDTPSHMSISHMESSIGTQSQPTLVRLFGHSINIGWDGLPAISSLSSQMDLFVTQCLTVSCSQMSVMKLISSVPDTNTYTLLEDKTPPPPPPHVKTQGLQDQQVKKHPAHLQDPHRLIAFQYAADRIDDGDMAQLDTVLHDILTLYDEKHPTTQHHTTASSSSSPPPSTITASTMASHITTAIMSIPLDIRLLALSMPITKFVTSRNSLPAITVSYSSSVVYFITCKHKDCLVRTDTREDEDIFATEVSSTATYASIDSLVLPTGYHAIIYANSVTSHPQLTICLNARCTIAVSAAVFEGVRVKDSSRIRASIGGDGNIIIVFTGDWPGSVVTSTSFISRYTTAGDSQQAFSYLRAANVINRQGIVSSSIDLVKPWEEIPQLYGLYDYIHDIKQRENMIDETMSILLHHQGYSLSPGGSGRVGSHIVVIHCSRLDCTPGYFTVALPLIDYDDITDVSIAFSDTGLPLIIAIKSEATTPPTSSLYSMVCLTHTCYRVADPTETGADPEPDPDPLPLFLDGHSYLSRHASNLVSLTGRLEVRSSPYGSAATLIQYEHQGHLVISQCVGPFCTRLIHNMNLDEYGECTASPCSDLRISAVDGLPFIAFGNSPPVLVHCSNILCVPYVMQ